MLYTISGEDTPNSLAKRLEIREQHLSRLRELQAAGRLVIAGPHPTIDSKAPGEAGFSGSLIIAEFDSLSDAKNWADSDPYLTHGVYQKVSVKPFIKALP